MSQPSTHSSRPDRLVLVLTTPSIPAGLVARGLLEDHDIPVMLKGEGEGPYRMGPVYLWVPEELETHARLILADATIETEEADLDDGDGEAGIEEEQAAGEE